MDVPVYDFHTPWIAFIQLALVFALPTLVGLVTDRLAASGLKVALLAILTAIGTILTGLLDSITAGMPYDWINAIGNAVVTILLSQAAYMGILKSTKIIAKAQDSTVIQLFGPSAKRVEAEQLAA